MTSRIREKRDAPSRQQRVLKALAEGSCSWDALRLSTKMDDNHLGLTLSALLNVRRIWTAEQEGVRIYGLLPVTGGGGSRSGRKADGK